MLATLTLENGITVPRKDYAESLAIENKLAVNDIYSLMRACETDEDLDDEAPKEWFDVVERICMDVDRTKDLAAGKTTIKEINLSIVSAKDMNAQEVSIVQAAKDTGLANGYSDLSSRLDFGADMNQCKPKVGAIVSPADFGAAIGMGFDMASKGMWIAGDAIAQLLAMGHENAVTQIAADLKLAYSTVSNYYRTALAVPSHQRALLPPSVAQEIVTAKYSEDKKENEEKRKALLSEAIAEKWNCSEARSHVKAAKGHDAPIDPKKEKQKNLELEVDRLQCIIREAYGLLAEGDAKGALKILKPEIAPF